MNTNISIPENRLAACCKANGTTWLTLRTRGDLDDDRQLVMALVKEIEIVGEAAARVSDAARERLPVKHMCSRIQHESSDWQGRPNYIVEHTLHGPIIR